MIADLKPYAEYKESGSPWLGQMPAHWNLPRLGSVLRERGETNEQKQVTQVLSVLKDVGVIRYEDKGNIGNKKSDDIGRYKIVRLDDIVVNCMNVIIGSVGRSRHVGCLSPVYYVLTRRCEVEDPRYLATIFSSKPFQLSLVRIGNGILSHRMRIPMELLKCEPFPVPPPEEQAAIVRFLDWANGRLERAIRAKRKVIALLNEQKQAIIHRAVTRGLDPSVPLKPSGIPWLGDIPQHWSVLPMKRVVQVRDGTHDTPPYVEPSDRSFPLVTSKDFGPSTISFDRTKHISEKHHREVVRRSDTERGDVLMSMIGGNIGKALIVDTDREFSIKNVALFKSCDAPALARFVLYYLQSGLLGIQIALLSKGGAQGFLGLGQIRNLQVAMMPANEMEDIVQALDLRLRDYDGLIAALRNSIDLVTEYRTRLVADVVTGKLDVREAAALLPDEAAPDTVTDDTDLSDETEPSDEEAAV